MIFEVLSKSDHSVILYLLYSVRLFVMGFVPLSSTEISKSRVCVCTEVAQYWGFPNSSTLKKVFSKETTSNSLFEQTDKKALKSKTYTIANHESSQVSF